MTLPLVIQAIHELRHRHARTRQTLPLPASAS
jgi:hypothetical protein